MAITEWSPFGSDDEDVPARRRRNAPAFRNLQREMNRLFEDFFEGSALRRSRGDQTPSRSSTRSFRPRIDVSEDEESLKISAELPGLDADDVELTADADSVTIKGEKSWESEEEDEGYYHSERSYGYFQRRVPFPVDVDTSNARATFEDGVLNVRFPKTGETSGERLEIETD